MACSPLNAGEEEGHKKEDIGEVLSEPGGKGGDDNDGKDDNGDGDHNDDNCDSDGDLM